MRQMKVMLVLDQNAKTNANKVFVANREGTFDNSDGTTEISLGWHSFSVQMQIDDETFRKLGSPHTITAIIPIEG